MTTSGVAILLSAFLGAVSPSAAEEGRRPESSRLEFETQVHFDKLDSLIERYTSKEKEGKALLAELSELGYQYAEGGDPDEILKRREELRGKIETSFDEIKEINGAFGSRHNLLNITIFASGMRATLESKSGRSTRAMSAKLLIYDGTFGRMKAHQRRVMRALRQDAVEGRVLALRLERRIWIRTLAIASVAFLCLIFISVKFWSRRSGSEGALAVPRVGPTEVGGLRIIEEIGRGENSVVYLAMDVHLGRKVALKCMRGEALRVRGEADKFLSEARMAASLKHPNLVEVYAIRQEGSEIYLVYELVEGRTLQEILDEREKLPSEEILPILRGVGRAVDYAHSEKIIHRDLKLSNVMMTESGEVKVMNFGLAYRARGTVRKVARAGVGGTPSYTAPEQEMGGVSKESDFFSLGVCCYELLTGRLPFPGPNYLAQKTEALFAPPSQVEPGLPKGLDAVLRRALAPESADRFHSAEEFVRAFEAALSA